MRRVGMRWAVGLGVVVVALAATTASAQDRGQGAAEFSVGHADFLDDGAIGHSLVGGAVRWYPTPRLSVGPEVVYMKGPRNDRDLFATGNLTFDIIPPARRSRVVPYVVAGGGFFQHRDRFGAIDFSSNEGAFTAGGGARVWLSPSVYAAGEVRTGWEPHLRYSGHLGVLFGRD